MKAIFTKYLGPTAKLPARIKAYDDDGNQVTISRHITDRVDDAYDIAAQMLRSKMGWTGELISGSFKGNYVYVFNPNGGKR